MQDELIVNVLFLSKRRIITKKQYIHCTHILQ